MNGLEEAAIPLSMCYLGHPVLREVAEPVATVDAGIRTLAKRMIATMRAHEGIGLAGNQIGERLRIVALDLPAARPDEQPFLTPGERVLLPRMPMVILNPELSEFSAEESDYTEGCLSIPGVNGDVTRPIELRLRAQTVEGEMLDLVCGGLLARCLMHEQDHLDGKLFIDYLTPKQLKPIKDKLRELEKRTMRELSSK